MSMARTTVAAIRAANHNKWIVLSKLRKSFSYIVSILLGKRQFLL